MACISGLCHTVTLSDSGEVYSFGQNSYGKLGLGHIILNILFPHPIPNLPKINQISCGAHFTVCVDYEGFIWTFGKNTFGVEPVDSGRSTYFIVPQIVNGIPPVQSVACGSLHTLIITHNNDLWSCGENYYGQLCLGSNENQSKFKKTSFSNISKISTGGFHSLFQNYKGKIFSCGYNSGGECGLGHSDHPQVKPTVIPGAHSNIVDFVCGSNHNLFLDADGKVYSTGYNIFGQLGLAHCTNQNVLNQIKNIPPVQTISCSGNSSYLIDFEGFVWSFGSNSTGQLGHGDTKHRKVPEKIEKLKDIQQISYSPTGGAFFAKDSQNTIFVTGHNLHGQLGVGDKTSLSIPKEMDPEYFTIWGYPTKINIRAKSARK